MYFVKVFSKVDIITQTEGIIFSLEYIVTQDDRMILTSLGESFKRNLKMRFLIQRLDNPI